MIVFEKKSKEEEKCVYFLFPSSCQQTHFISLFVREEKWLIETIISIFANYCFSRWRITQHTKRRNKIIEIKQEVGMGEKRKITKYEELKD